MLATREDYTALLRCPSTLRPLEWRGTALSPRTASTPLYPLVDGVPVLVDFDNSVLVREAVTRTGAESVVERKRRSGLAALTKRLLSPPKASTRSNIRSFRALLAAFGARPLVLVIGGGTVGQGLEPLYQDPDLRLVAFDIYRSPDIHFVADAHAIPLADESVDGVIVQAVLEHVLQPQQVVAEIWRVLRSDGIVYSETPFLQQVHEGRYDFTRFTESGHRYLFRRFELVRSGPSGGPGAQLLWSIDYFFRSLFRSRAAGKLAKLAFVWLRLFDRLIPTAFASDAASGTFFLGRKSALRITPREAVDFYRGAQR